MLSIPELYYKDARNLIRSGDILLASGNAMFSKLIKFATKSEWSHVAFIMRQRFDRFFVFESVETIGVRTVPLSGYVYDYNGTKKGYNGRLLIARHEDVDVSKLDEKSNKAANIAISMLGYPYDSIEIGKIAGRLLLRRFGIGIDREPEDNGVDICSEYDDRLFKAMDIKIKRKHQRSIVPNDYYKDPKIHPVCYVIPQTVYESPYY